MERDLDEKERILDESIQQSKRQEIERDDISKHLAKNHDIPIKLQYVLTRLFSFTENKVKS